MKFITLTIQTTGTPLYIQANAINAICQNPSSHITEVHTQTEIFFVHESVEEVLNQIKPISDPEKSINKAIQMQNAFYE